MNPIAQIPDNQLTHKLWEESKNQARLEREWEIVDHQRLVVLAELTKLSDEKSHTAAEREARMTKEYKDFLIKRGEIKEQLTLARAKTKAIELEIRLRINKSFAERAEYQGGKLNP